MSKLHTTLDSSATESSKSYFSKRRILTVTLITLGFALAFFSYEVSKPIYVLVEEGQGEWVKSLDNGEEVFTESSSGDYTELTFLEALSEITWGLKAIGFFVLALIFMFCRDLGYIWRIMSLTEGFLSFKKALRVIFVWEFASALSPGVVGGTAVAMFILNREKISFGKSTSIVMVTALLDNLFYVIFALLFMLLFPTEVLFGENNSWFVSLFWTGYFIMLAATVFLFVAIFLYPRIVGIVFIWISKIPFLKKFRRNLINTALDIKTTSREMRSKKWLYWAKAFGATCFSWASRFLVINCVIMMVAPMTSFGDNIIILAKQFVMWLVMLVSPTPGASGVAEVLFSDIMEQFFPIAVLAGVAGLIWRMISYFPYIFIGAVLTPRWLRKTELEKVK